MHVQYSEIYNTWQTFLYDNIFMPVNGNYDHYNLDVLDAELYKIDMYHNRYTGKIERFDNDKQRLEHNCIIQYRLTDDIRVKFLLHETIYCIQQLGYPTQKLTRNNK